MFQPRRQRDEAYDNEKAQALIRAVVIGCACLYLLPQIYGGIAPPEARFVAYLVTGHWVFAVALYGGSPGIPAATRRAASSPSPSISAE